MTNAVSLASTELYESPVLHTPSLKLRVLMRLIDNMLLGLMAIIPMMLVMIVTIFAISKIFPDALFWGPPDMVRNLLKVLAQLILWVSILSLEAFYLSRQGFTPVKGLAGVRVGKQDCDTGKTVRLSFSEAMGRGFHASLAWVFLPYGLWLAFQYKSRPRLPWDEPTTTLHQKPVASWRLWVINIVGSILLVLDMILRSFVLVGLVS